MRVKNGYRYLVLLAVMLVAVCRVSAQTQEELRREIEGYEQEIRAARELLDRTQKDRSANENQLKIIRNQITNQRNMIATLGKRLDVIGRDINRKNSDIKNLQSQIERLKKDYAEMIYASYKNYKLNNFIVFLFASNDFNTATRRMDFMQRYNRMRRRKAEEIALLSDSLRNEIVSLDTDRAEMDRTRETHNSAVTDLGKDETKYRNTVTELTAQQKRLNQSVQEKQALINKAQQQIQELIAAEVRRSQSQTMSDADLKALAALSGQFDENRGKLPFPIRGGVVIDRYGEHAHQLVSNTRVNNPGINIAGDPGAAVNCVFEGKVAEIVSIPTYNRCILVRHGNYITVYANLVSVAVRKGDTVATGQMLGRIDSSTGNDNNFLHFEIRKEAETLNPEQWLRRN